MFKDSLCINTHYLEQFLRFIFYLDTKLDQLQKKLSEIKQFIQIVNRRNH